VIVDNGHAPDGTGYEWTAYRADNRYEIDGKDVRVDEFCVGFDWPDVAARGRPAGCSSVDDSPDDPSDIEYLAAWSNQWLQDRAEGVRRRDVMLWGMTTHEPRDVRIRYTDAQGRGHDVPVDFRRVQGELLRRAGGARPFGVFVGFIGAEQAARDLRSRYPDLSLIVPRAPGPLQAEWLPEVCKSDADHGPFEYRFYGSDGKLLDRVRTIVLHPASQPCIDAMQELDDSGFVPPEEP
jgi:hypothetical protein